MSATGNRKAQAGFEPLVSGFVRVPYDDLEAIKAVAEHNKNIVAVMLEIVQGEGGIYLASLEYQRNLRKLCDEQGWLLICDEVQCGMARTGKWFGYQHAGIQPDIATLAKGLGGMVELTTGKMKSREGTVVNADDLVDEMVATSKQHTEELGKVKDFSEEEMKERYNTIGMGAMKFYLLRVYPKKTMVFNPQDSIDFHGFTGPFIQYTYARIKSILRKVGNGSVTNDPMTNDLLPLEKELIIASEQYPSIIEQACAEHNTSVIANYVFHLAKTFNSLYTEHSIANAESEEKKQLRLQLATFTANINKSGMQLLGIKVPERM